MSCTVRPKRPTPAAWPPRDWKWPSRVKALYWSREEVDQKLHGIMKSIHKQCLDAAETYGKKGDYLLGGNIAGFIKVAKAMLAYGIV